MDVLDVLDSLIILVILALVVGSSVQSGLLSKFGKTETETSLLRLKDLTKLD